MGSRDGGGNRTTVYSIGDQQVELDAAFNSTATVSLNWVKADNNGELQIDITKGAGASYGYLNALVIKETNLMFQNPTAVQATLSGVDTGTYWVALQVLDDDCGSTTDTVLITIDVLTNTSISPTAPTVQLMPNPTTGIVNLSIEGHSGTLNLLLYNAAGQVLQQQTIQQGNTTLELTKVPTGLYLITLQDASGNLLGHYKLIKQ